MWRAYGWWVWLQRDFGDSWVRFRNKGGSQWVQRNRWETNISVCTGEHLWKKLAVVHQWAMDLQKRGIGFMRFLTKFSKKNMCTMGKLMIMFVFVKCPRVKNQASRFTIDNNFFYSTYRAPRYWNENHRKFYNANQDNVVLDLIYGWSFWKIVTLVFGRKIIIVTDSHINLAIIVVFSHFLTVQTNKSF